MELVIITVFVLGYAAITLEHSLKIDKLIPALLMMALAWACVAIGLDGFTTWFDSANHEMVKGFSDLPLHGEHHGVTTKMSWLENTLLHHFGKTCEILMFLIGAMTIVEIIDHFNGFSTIKKYFNTCNFLLFVNLFVIFTNCQFAHNISCQRNRSSAPYCNVMF